MQNDSWKSNFPRCTFKAFFLLCYFTVLFKVTKNKASKFNHLSLIFQTKQKTYSDKEYRHK